MFFTHQQHSQNQEEKKAGIRQANVILHRTINSYFETHWAEMRQELITNGLSPEGADDFLRKFKLDMQKQAVCRVREIAQQLAEKSHTVSKDSVEAAYR